jgi:hypothetical protein
MLNEEKSQDSGELLDRFYGLIRFCLRRWWLIVIFSAIGGLLGFLYSNGKKTLFEAKISFALEDNSTGSGLLSGAMGLASELGFSMGAGNDIFGGENIVPIITSRKIVEGVLLTTDSVDGKMVTFADHYIQLHLKDALPKSIRQISIPVGIQRMDLTIKQDSLLYLAYTDIIKKRLFAGRMDRRYGIFEVTFQSQNERFSKEFISRILEETIIFYTKLRTEKSKSLLVVLEQRVNNLKGNLNASISRQNDVLDANINPVFKSSLTPVLEEEVNKQAYGEAYATLFANLEMARLQYLKDVPLLQVIDEPNYPLKRLEKSKLIFTIAGLILGGIIIILGLTIVFSLKPKNTR